jgi:hypothetical protein
MVIGIRAEDEMRSLLFLALAAASLAPAAAAAPARPCPPMRHFAMSAAVARQNLPPELTAWSKARAVRPLGSARAFWMEAEGAARQSKPQLDMSDMPIEEAVMLMFMLVSEDSRADTRAMLDEMEQIRKQKAAIRAAQERMKADQSRERRGGCG